MTDNSMTPAIPPMPHPGMAKYITESLPLIIEGFKDIYTLRTKKEAFQLALASRCEELHINSQNFSTLVQGLTELSKEDGADEATKKMYRVMIQSLFELFTARSKNSSSFAEFMNSFQ